MDKDISNYYNLLLFGKKQFRSVKDLATNEIKFELATVVEEQYKDLIDEDKNNWRKLNGLDRC